MESRDAGFWRKNPEFSLALLIGVNALLMRLHPSLEACCLLTLILAFGMGFVFDFMHRYEASLSDQEALKFQRVVARFTSQLNPNSMDHLDHFTQHATAFFSFTFSWLKKTVKTSVLPLLFWEDAQLSLYACISSLIAVRITFFLLPNLLLPSLCFIVLSPFKFALYTLQCLGFSGILIVAFNSAFAFHLFHKEVSDLTAALQKAYETPVALSMAEVRKVFEKGCKTFSFVQHTLFCNFEEAQTRLKAHVERALQALLWFCSCIWNAALPVLEQIWAQPLVRDWYEKLQPKLFRAETNARESVKKIRDVVENVDRFVTIVRELYREKAEVRMKSEEDEGETTRDDSEDMGANFSPRSMVSENSENDN